MNPPDQTVIPHPNSADALNERQLNRIPGHKVFAATEALPEDQRLAIRRLHAHYYDNQLSLEGVGKEVGYDGGTLSKVFHGRYEGDLAAVVKAITRFLRLTEERATVKAAPYIETGLYRDLEQCCQAALTYQKIVMIFGESQVGKTAALRHYAAKHNHGETTMVEMPAGGSLSHFQAALAEALRMSPQSRGEIMSRNIMGCLGPNNLLIVDEVLRALQSRSYGGSSLKTLDFIRALHDQTGCGIVLCGTNIFRDTMRDPKLVKFLNQFNRRCLLRRQLPDVPDASDLAAFAKHYRLATAEGEALALQNKVVITHGLGVWLTTLRAAAKKAAKEGRPMTWGHVIQANAFFARMEMVNEGRAA